MPAWRCPTCLESHVAEWVCEICGIGLKDGVNRLCAKCTDYYLRGEKAWRDFQALEAEIHTVVELFLPPFEEAEPPRIVAIYAPTTWPIPLDLLPHDLDERLRRIAP